MGETDTGVKRRASTLIVAEPGRMRDSLCILLATLPQIAIVGEADDGASAQSMVAKYKPALIVLDSDLAHEASWSLLAWLKRTQPLIPCLVLATNGEKQRLARANGANAVLLKGFGLAELLAAIEWLLTPPEMRTVQSGQPV